MFDAKKYKKVAYLRPLERKHSTIISLCIWNYFTKTKIRHFYYFIHFEKHATACNKTIPPPLYNLKYKWYHKVFYTQLILSYFTVFILNVHIFTKSNSRFVICVDSYINRDILVQKKFLSGKSLSTSGSDEH